MKSSIYASDTEPLFPPRSTDRNSFTTEIEVRQTAIKKLSTALRKSAKSWGADRISALMTTSEYSLDYPREIIDAYRENGFHSIFIRALNPYGLAKENDDWTAYCDRFVAFYKQALEYILEINKSGETFIEEFATLILRKILTPFPIGFVDLQSPSGIVNGVAVYNYDGYVYASDESRMLAEYDDYTFRLGRVSDCYENLFYGRRVQEISRLWATEYIAGCADCAFQSICGADPCEIIPRKATCMVFVRPPISAANTKRLSSISSNF